MEKYVPVAIRNLADRPDPLDQNAPDLRRMDSVELRDAFQRHATRLLLSPEVLKKIQEDLVGTNPQVRLQMAELLLRHLLPVQSISVSKKISYTSKLERPPKEVNGHAG